MAVIITDMDMPKSCVECPILYDCMLCPITSTKVNFDRMTCEKLKNCPLKSADEMIAEIDNVYIGYRHAYEVAHDYTNIIHKYCDKEQNNE